MKTKDLSDVFEENKEARKLVSKYTEPPYCYIVNYGYNASILGIKMQQNAVFNYGHIGKSFLNSSGMCSEEAIKNGMKTLLMQT